LFGVIEPPPGEVAISASVGVSANGGPTTLVPPPLPPRLPVARRLDENEPAVPADPEADRPRRRPADADGPTGTGALIGMLAIAFAGFFVLMGGVIYMLWPATPGTKPVAEGPTPPEPAPVVADPPKRLDDILKEAPANERGNRPPERPGTPRFEGPGRAMPPGVMPGGPGFQPPGPAPRRVNPAPAGPPPDPTRFAPVVPLPIKPPRLPRPQTEVPLPGPVESAVVAGGGRLLLLHVPNAHKVLVFDVSEAKIAKQIDAPDADTMLAGGMNTFVLYQPKANTIERWTCDKLERQPAVKSPFADPVKVLAMGCASNGPLVAALGGTRKTFFDGTTVAYFDPATMTEVSYAVDGRNQLGLGSRNKPPAIRVSANGAVVTGWGPSSPDGVQCDVIGPGRITRHWPLGLRQPVLPAPDGKILYGRGQVLGPNLGGPPAGFVDDSHWYVPAVQGDYYAVIREPERGFAGPGQRPGTIAIYRWSRNGAVASVDSAEDLDLGRAEAGLDQSLFLVPEAQVLITVAGPKRNKLTLRRVEQK
jgi:hypothetical protein